MDKPIERLEARVSRPKILLLMMGAIGFVALGIWFVKRADAPTEIVLVGWASILFFGACAIVGARQLFRTEPVIEIDRDGVLWRRWSEERIPWSAVTRAAPMRMGRQNFLCLWLAEPARYRSTRTLGRLASVNKSMGFGDIALSMQGTDRSFDELLYTVDRLVPGLIGRD